jgi:hypothetical protein
MTIIHLKSLRAKTGNTGTDAFKNEKVFAEI